MTKEELIVCDAFADMMRAKLFAAKIHILAAPLPRPPRRFFSGWKYDRDMRKSLNGVGLHLTDEVRIRWYQAAMEGQGFDDATGYWLRCWCAAFGFPFKAGREAENARLKAEIDAKQQAYQDVSDRNHDLAGEVKRLKADKAKMMHGMKMARLAMDSYGARTGENEFETSIAEIDRILKEVGAV